MALTTLKIVAFAAIPQGERQYSHRGEAWILGKGAQTETNVLRECLDDRFPARSVNLILHHLHISHLHACSPHSLLGAHPCSYLLVCRDRKIGIDFLVKLLRDLLPVKQSAQPADNRLSEGHQISPHCALRIRAIAAVWFSHPCVSALSRLRPSSVSL